jgi:hypothetical protein
MMDAIIARLREPQLVGEMHELIFPVFAQSSDEMESLFKEELHEGSGNGAVISSLPRSFLTIEATGVRSSTLPVGSLHASNSPWSLTVRCNVKPKNHPMLLLPRLASAAKTRCWLIRLGSQTRHPTLSR